MTFAQGGSAATCEAKSGATCLYVDPVKGNDANSASADSPVRRPQVAIRKAKAGDFIYLRGGTYTSEHANQGKLIQLGDIPNENWNTPNGTADRPITLKSYPGEVAVAKDAGGIVIGSTVTEVAYWNIENLVMDGSPLRIAGGARSTAGQAPRQVHHIQIRGNEIFNVKGQGGSNPGIIKIDRGDWGGPSDIVIDGNKLHDLFDANCTGTGCAAPGLYDWKSTPDRQHFGAITTLSCETYNGVSCGGNGALTIRNNIIYNVPMAMFFKNPNEGPVLIEGNTIYNAQALGRIANSNANFSRNLVFNVTSGFLVGGYGGSSTPDIWALSGHNLTMEYNTFVGVNGIVRFTEYGSYHTIRRNVAFGLTRRKAGGTWDTPGFVARGVSDASYSDKGPEVALSELNTGNKIDENCFVTPYSDFIAVSRYLPTSTVTHWSLDQAQSIFKFDLSSKLVIQSNDSAGMATIFTNPGKGDFRIKSTGPCAGMGAEAPPTPTKADAPGSARPRMEMTVRHFPGRVAFILPWNAPPEGARLLLQDAKGVVIKEWGRMTSSTLAWDTRSLAPGVYFARLSWPTGTSSSIVHPIH